MSVKLCRYFVLPMIKIQLNSTAWFFKQKSKCKKKVGCTNLHFQNNKLIFIISFSKLKKFKKSNMVITDRQCSKSNIQKKITVLCQRGAEKTRTSDK